MKINPSEEPERNVCDGCDGAGRIVDKMTAWAVCPVCRGTGTIEV